MSFNDSVAGVITQTGTDDDLSELAGKYAVAVRDLNGHKIYILPWTSQSDCTVLKIQGTLTISGGMDTLETLSVGRIEIESGGTLILGYQRGQGGDIFADHLHAALIHPGKGGFSESNGSSDAEDTDGNYLWDAKKPFLGVRNGGSLYWICGGIRCWGGWRFEGGSTVRIGYGLKNKPWLDTRLVERDGANRGVGQVLYNKAADFEINGLKIFGKPDGTDAINGDYTSGFLIAPLEAPARMDGIELYGTKGVITGSSSIASTKNILFKDYAGNLGGGNDFYDLKAHDANGQLNLVLQNSAVGSSVLAHFNGGGYGAKAALFVSTTVEPTLVDDDGSTISNGIAVLQEGAGGAYRYQANGGTGLLDGAWTRSSAFSAGPGDMPAAEAGNGVLVSYHNQTIANNRDYFGANDTTTLYSYAYGKKPTSIPNVNLRTLGGVAPEVVFFDDPNITESSEATVAAYTTLDNAAELYDFASHHKSTSGGVNWPNIWEPLVSAQNGRVHLKPGYTLRIDATATDVYNLSGTTLTVKSSSFDMTGVTADTVTTANDAVLTGEYVKANGKVDVVITGLPAGLVAVAGIWKDGEDRATTMITGQVTDGAATSITIEADPDTSYWLVADARRHNRMEATPINSGLYGATAQVQLEPIIDPLGAQLVPLQTDLTAAQQAEAALITYDAGTGNVQFGDNGGTPFSREAIIWKLEMIQSSAGMLVNPLTAKIYRNGQIDLDASSTLKMMSATGVTHAPDISVVTFTKGMERPPASDVFDFANGHLYFNLGAPIVADLGGMDIASQTSLNLVKAKTDNLPADPASETNVDAVAGEVWTVGTRELTVAAGLTTAQETKLDAVKAQTDNLWFHTPAAGQNAKSPGTAFKTLACHIGMIGDIPAMAAEVWNNNAGIDTLRQNVLNTYGVAKTSDIPLAADIATAVDAALLDAGDATDLLTAIQQKIDAINEASGGVLVGAIATAVRTAIEGSTAGLPLSTAALDAIWTRATRTLTSSPLTAGDVWGYGTRELTVAAGLTATQEATLDAVKAKTDSLPADPASETNVDAVAGEVWTVGNRELTVSSGLTATQEATLDAVHSAVTHFPETPANPINPLVEAIRDEMERSTGMLKSARDSARLAASLRGAGGS